MYVCTYIFTAINGERENIEHYHDNARYMSLTYLCVNQM